MGYSWQIKEEIEIGTSNPRSAMRIVLPEDWTTKQREDFLEAVRTLMPDQKDDYEII